MTPQQFKQLLMRVLPQNGTTVYLPEGIYIIAGALVTSDINGLNPNSQLYFPAGAIDNTIERADVRTIKLQGENYAPLVITSSLNNDQPVGTILKSTLNQGTGTRPSIIGGIGFTTGNPISKMSYTTMFLENINIVASSNGAATCPNVIAVNGLDMAQLIFRNGTVSMDCYLYANTMPNPSTTATNSAGVITGRRDNNGGNIIENVWIQGAWHRGFVIGEHTYFKFAWTMGLHTAYTFLDTNFEIVGDIGSNSVVTYLEFPNAGLYGETPGTAFVNLNFAYEASGVGGSPPAWLSPTNLLVDVGENGRGKITYIAQGGADVGNFRPAIANEYGLQIVPSTRILPRKHNTAGGAISSGYGTTSGFGDNSAIFELSNSVQATGTYSEFANLVLSTKNNLPDGRLAQILVMNNTGASGLAADPLEKRAWTLAVDNDGASLNGKVYENIFTGSNKRISERTGDLQQWFTNGTERFRIASAGQFGLGGANYGTSGQTIISQGPSGAPIWGDKVLANTSDATSHTVTLSGGTSLQLIEGSNITLTTGGTGGVGTVTIAATGGGGGLTYAQTKAIAMKIR